MNNDEWVSKSSYDALAAAKDASERDLAEAREALAATRIDLQTERDNREVLSMLLHEVERQRDALRESLRQMSCPRPCNGRPDDFTAGQCIDAGECGCIAQVAALKDEGGARLSFDEEEDVYSAMMEQLKRDIGLGGAGE